MPTADKLSLTFGWNYCEGIQGNGNNLKEGDRSRKVRGGGAKGLGSMKFII